THLVRWKQPGPLKKKYNLQGHLVLSTFGLIGPNKSIETALRALPEIVKYNPTVKYLILGKTHPELVKREGEKYREELEKLVAEVGLGEHVEFVNKYLSLEELLEYLQLTDVYLFTSKDPNQAVSGTFAYALSCACPIVSTPIPHAVEMLDESVGKIVPFQDHIELANSTIELLKDERKRSEMSLNAFHKTRVSIWENVAVSYARLLKSSLDREIELKYNLPAIRLNHLKRMTAKSGILQFSKLGIPDISSGYTLDDNARALVAMVMYYKRFRQPDALKLIEKYFDFITYCQRPDGRFYNYVDSQGEFHKQNHYTNLEDSNGRAVWALGFLVANSKFLPDRLIQRAIITISKCARHLLDFHSPRAMAFAIKGLCYHNLFLNNPTLVELVEELSDKLVNCYSKESDKGWDWFEGYLTYANSVLPEALLLAYELTEDEIYREVAVNSMDFLISKIFINGQIKVISNRGWLSKGKENEHFGEQPIDVAYTILALDTFTKILKTDRYETHLTTAFEWFLGNNHLGQIIYNAASGGCYDGLEEDHPNLNEGAESTICYLLSRLAVERYHPAVPPRQVLQLPKIKVRKTGSKIPA
ncbi:MAG: glycosyltransferase, partial [Cyclobacteriaceae bacterium]